MTRHSFSCSIQIRTMRTIIVSLTTTTTTTTKMSRRYAFHAIFSNIKMNLKFSHSVPAFLSSSHLDFGAGAVFFSWFRVLCLCGVVCVCLPFLRAHTFASSSHSWFVSMAFCTIWAFNLDAGSFFHCTIVISCTAKIISQPVMANPANCLHIFCTAAFDESSAKWALLIHCNMASSHYTLTNYSLWNVALFCHCRRHRHTIVATAFTHSHTRRSSPIPFIQLKAKNSTNIH